MIPTRPSFKTRDADLTDRLSRATETELRAKIAQLELEKSSAQERALAMTELARAEASRADRAEAFARARSNRSSEHPLKYLRPDLLKRLELPTREPRDD